MGEVYTAFLPRRNACKMAIRATAVLPDPVGAMASRSSLVRVRVRARARARARVRIRARVRVRASRSSLSSTMTSRHDTWAEGGGAWFM
eukprot:scaffold83106_cov42-Phaeocystis_antarctica.AAC.1